MKVWKGFYVGNVLNFVFAVQIKVRFRISDFDYVGIHYFYFEKRGVVNLY